MRALSLLLFFLLAGPAAAQDASDAPTGCTEDRTTCREDCSIEYGSSTRNLKKLGSCIGTCNYKYDKCRERHLALQKQKKSGPRPTPGSTTPASPEEPGATATVEGSTEGDTAPSSTSEPTESDEAPARRGVYRASEAAEPAPAKSGPESKPAETTASAEEEPLVDEEPPPPPPKPKPASTRPQSPPEPKKDISDWDPDGK
jgi:hypothetical protein